MRHRYLAVLLALAAAFTGLAVHATTPPALADPESTVGAESLTFALLGDTPYDDVQRAQFPALVGDVNADPEVRLVLHAGDIHNGESACTDALLADRAALYATFDDPFVLTPGDNDWTDCHRSPTRSYLPTERLAAVRRHLFPRHGWTNGRHRMQVWTQADDNRHAAYVENVMFAGGPVLFASVHVVGSENDLLPWTQLTGGDRPAERLAEFAARQTAARYWIRTTFERAAAGNAAGILFLLHAEPTDTPGYSAVRAEITQRAAVFRRPVLLVHGDEHVYEVESSYAGVPHLTRLETFGDTATRWLRVTVDRRNPAVFSWTPEVACPRDSCRR